ncbi:uracil-DNA glycosylase [Candidatus Acetothermia bacterium]|nr:uracil-DNA glycosylase [Candidatus Acetothermia bacterium]MCI2426235.1 uracil-DNA glycosylase [Candidatus Acetothermia bacterium]
MDSLVSATKLSITQLAAQVNECTLCQLHKTRTNVVFGEGNLNAALMLIGEGPGEVEDQQGRPFVGPAGQKLDEILASVGIMREEVYITNVVKCRPPGNRAPLPEEMERCRPYLEAQIALINPQIILSLGNVPTRMLLETNDGITMLRGQFKRWRGGIEIFPIFHPSYLLRYQSREKGSPKYLTWIDIQKVKERLDRNRTT